MKKKGIFLSINYKRKVFKCMHLRIKEWRWRTMILYIFVPISEIEYFEETTKDTVKLTVHISFPIVIFSKIKVNVKEQKKKRKEKNTAILV